MSKDENAVLRDIKSAFEDHSSPFTMVQRLQHKRSEANSADPLWKFASECAVVFDSDNFDLPFPSFYTEQHARFGIEVLFPFVYNSWRDDDTPWTRREDLTATFVEIVHNMSCGGFSDYLYYREWLQVFDVLAEVRVDDEKSIAFTLCMLNRVLSTHNLFVDQHATRLFGILQKLLMSGSCNVKTHVCAALLRFELFAHTLFCRGLKQIIIEQLNAPYLLKHTVIAFSRVLAEYASTSWYALRWTQKIAVDIVLSSKYVKRHWVDIGLFEITMKSPQTFSYQQLCRLDFYQDGILQLIFYMQILILQDLHFC